MNKYLTLFAGDSYIKNIRKVRIYTILYYRIEEEIKKSIKKAGYEE